MTAKDDCYKLIQQIVVKRDVFCKYPSCFSQSSAGHHLFKRDRLATAFLPEAVIGLCVDHHTPRWVEDPVFIDYLVAMMGERYYELQRLSYTVVRNFDFKECRKQLRRICAPESRDLHTCWQ